MCVNAYVLLNLGFYEACCDVDQVYQYFTGTSIVALLSQERELHNDRKPGVLMKVHSDDLDGPLNGPMS